MEVPDSKSEKGKKASQETEKDKNENESAEQKLPLQNPAKPVKPPKPEEKPFSNFILEDLIPGLTEALKRSGVEPISIQLKKGPRPVVGGECSMIICEIPPGRRFWLAFSKDELTSNKTITLAETGSEPFLLESFLIDERKATLSLLISRILQRLNGQKWLGPN
tara:strand:- start:738 stop:1229 length:492 start_codon:yes stop_codon:yes gene_type:complete